MLHKIFVLSLFVLGLRADDFGKSVSIFPFFDVLISVCPKDKITMTDGTTGAIPKGATSMVKFAKNTNCTFTVSHPSYDVHSWNALISLSSHFPTVSQSEWKQRHITRHPLVTLSSLTISSEFVPAPCLKNCVAMFDQTSSKPFQHLRHCCERSSFCCRTRTECQLLIGHWQLDILCPIQLCGSWVLSRKVLHTLISSVTGYTQVKKKTGEYFNTTLEPNKYYTVEGATGDTVTT